MCRIRRVCKARCAHIDHKVARGIVNSPHASTNRLLGERDRGPIVGYRSPFRFQKELAVRKNDVLKTHFEIMPKGILGGQEIRVKAEIRVERKYPISPGQTK